MGKGFKYCNYIIKCIFQLAVDHMAMSILVALTVMIVSFISPKVEDIVSSSRKSRPSIMKESLYGFELG